MDKLNVLYICDDGFAEMAGVSITSLFENNPKEQLQITIYLLGVNLRKENQERFRTLSCNYGQQIIMIDAAGEYEEIQKTKLECYRGSAMTNLRLHFDCLVPDTVQRLLYIDCDTVICASLAELATAPMHGRLLGMVLDAYGKMLRIHKDEPYYSAGVILINCERWRSEGWHERIDDFIRNKSIKLRHPDQDVLNILCKDEIVRLSMRYNFQVVHKAYSDQLYFKHLGQENYYTCREIDEARKHPAIVHLIRMLGTNPWYADGKCHLEYALYMRYKEMSEWKAEIPIQRKANAVFLCERILQKILPGSIFFPLKVMALKITMIS